MDEAQLAALRTAAMEQSRNLERQQLRIKLKTETVRNPSKSEAAGTDVYDDVDMVEFHVIGDGLNIHSKALKNLTRDEARDFAPLVAYYKALRENVPTSGAPLKMVTWLSPAQVRTYEALNVHTLENLAGVSDATITKLGMGAREHVKKAQAHLQAAQDASAVNRLVDSEARLMAEVDGLKAQIKELKNMLDALQDTAMAKLEIPEHLRRIG